MKENPMEQASTPVIVSDPSFVSVLGTHAKIVRFAERKRSGVRRWTPLLLMSAAVIFATGSAAADPMFSYTAIPDTELLSLDEGELGLVSYTLTNTGNLPLYTLTGSFILNYVDGDPSDFPLLLGEAGPPDGAFFEVVPGMSFKYEWVFGAIDDGDLSIDSGLWVFTPFFLMAEAPFAVDGWLNWDAPSNGLRSVLIQVNDVPEPSSFPLLGAGLFGLGMLRRYRKMKHKPSL